MLLLDRDGVINVDLARGVCRLDDLTIYESSLRALAELERAGVTVAVVTNQANVGRGILSLPELDRIHAGMRSMVHSAGGHLDSIFVCPHLPEDGCACRKPMPGLLLQALGRYGVAPSSVCLVGDDIRDVQAAESIGCCRALVRTGKGASAASLRPDVPSYADLEDFVRHFIAGLE